LSLLCGGKFPSINLKNLTLKDVKLGVVMRDVKEHTDNLHVYKSRCKTSEYKH